MFEMYRGSNQPGSNEEHEDARESGVSTELTRCRKAELT